MRIANSREKAEECPQDKLKFLSFIDDLQSTRALHPVTPERSNKEWVMDAWEDHSQYDTSSPEKNRYINRLIQNYEGKSFRLKKIQFFSEKPIRPEKMCTPVRQQKQEEYAIIQKENKPKQRAVLRIRPKQYSITKSSRKGSDLQESSAPYKMPLSSVIYPVVRQPQTDRQLIGRGGRRLQRFHSFVARSIRK